VVPTESCFCFKVTHRNFENLQSHPQKDAFVLMLPAEKRFVSKLPTENRNGLSVPTKEGFLSVPTKEGTHRRADMAWGYPCMK